MTKFYYPYTCPDIDRAIKDTKSRLRESIKDFIDEHIPSFDLKNHMTDKYVENIHPEIVDCFEDVRKANQDMRKSAEQQISELDEIIESMRDEILDLKSQIEDLNKEIKLLDA